MMTYVSAWRTPGARGDSPRSWHRKLPEILSQSPILFLPFEDEELGSCRGWPSPLTCKIPFWLFGLLTGWCLSIIVCGYCFQHAIPPHSWSHAPRVLTQPGRGHASHPKAHLHLGTFQPWEASHLKLRNEESEIQLLRGGVGIRIHVSDSQSSALHIVHTACVHMLAHVLLPLFCSFWNAYSVWAHSKLQEYRSELNRCAHCPHRT